jgi:small GTP-binding protein
MYFDKQRGPIAFDTTPKEISKDVESLLGKLFDVSEEEGFFEHNSKLGKEPFACANYLFFMDSAWARGEREMVMLSLIVEDNIKLEIFEDTLTKFATAMKSIKDGFKAFYAKSDKSDSGIEKSLKLIKLLVTDCYEACRRKPEAQKPGKLLVLGLQAVGKTSIINQLTKAKFDPKIKPTMGMQLVRSAIDNFKFQIYDLGGQEKIRKTWYDKPINPDAVIFVLDVSASKEQQDLAKEEFDRMCENFFNADSEKKLADGTPLLILGNKADLNESFTAKKIESLLKPSKDINYKVGLCSALKNEGFEDNFKWLVKSFLFM